MKAGREEARRAATQEHMRSPSRSLDIETLKTLEAALFERHLGECDNKERNGERNVS